MTTSLNSLAIFAITGTLTALAATPVMGGSLDASMLGPRRSLPLKTRNCLCRRSNRSLSAPPIPSGKRFRAARDRAGIFGDECLLRGAETGLSRAFPAKAPGS
jgi:hypothetical protein